MEAPAQLAAVLGSAHVLGGLCGTVSFVVGPGQIRSIGDTHFIKLGELDGKRSERAERLAQAFVRAGIKVEIAADINAALCEAGVATPLHSFIYSSLLPLALRARQQLSFPA